ncbi:MAG: TIGR00730 family Rossman fold protein [Alphaproteobacteria bacterium]|nr:TIGR00730 family Rossman fold protein [Alphaproteobacteria bacterium]
MAEKRSKAPHPSKQSLSPSYRIPALDQDFILSDSMRGVRFLLEYAKAEEALRAHGIRSTIVVFGSARISEKGNGERQRWYAEARAFGRLASERGGALSPNDGVHDNVIATGGGPGVMEAANRGASEAGALSVGFNIHLPHEQEPNRYSTPNLTFQFHYFAMRKMHLAMRANALAIFPGGFGTLDEMFEMLTLHQTGKVTRLPVVLFDKAYWTRIVSFDTLVKEDMIAPEDAKLFQFADSAEEAWEKLVEQGLPLAAKRTEQK